MLKTHNFLLFNLKMTIYLFQDEAAIICKDDVC